MTETLLEVRHLAMHFPLRDAARRGLRRGQRPVLRAVDGVDIEVGRGETVGLVGESGCGKSTLARCIVGLYEPTAGEIRYRGEVLPSKRERATRRRMQMVFQDPYSSLNPRMTVRQMLRELLTVHTIVPKERVDARCAELLDLVGLSPRSLDAYPRQFSGGQRQRVSIARALALEPELLVADEPVSALDVSVQATVLNLLEELQQKLGLAILLIAHNMAIVRHTCNRVAVMYLGRIVETATTPSLFSDPRHPYTQGLLRAVPQLTPGRPRQTVAVVGDPPSAIAVPTGCRFHPRCPIAQEPLCHSEDPALESGPWLASHLAACHFAWTARPASHVPEVELETERS
jgi:oligopeptide/dipeptide ABC transporter ATP-binding protein